MSTFVTFVHLGLSHILAWGALDHLLFLLVLVAPCRASGWRGLVAVASAFTVGHSVTLVLVATGAVHFRAPVIEFLIPLTIVATGIENLVRGPAVPSGLTRPMLAALFGLIHGAGFANVLREMFIAPIALPLVGFNAGIELAQLAVIALLLLSFSALDRLAVVRRPIGGQPLRTAVASGIAVVWAAAMAASRSPW